jgi:hypothetical protein
MDHDPFQHWASAYNYTWTYISGQLKKSIYEYARRYDGSFPFLGKIQAIANCTIKLFLSEDEALSPMNKAEVRENINRFKLYWDVLLGRCCPVHRGPSFGKATPSITPLFLTKTVLSPLKWRHFVCLSALAPNLWRLAGPLDSRLDRSLSSELY